MKKVKIFWTSFADKSLEQIHQYIARESGSDFLASCYIEKLISRVDQLEYFPESGSKDPLLKGYKPYGRYLLEGNYKIIYQYDGKEIIITDVFHMKQNPSKIRHRTKKK
ncbi:MAG TPA: type II toxin-antitoxin system RelE/ParE family toxin [Cytophagaceae bacterium]|jgi:plasmid stabilization system protein ParE|nr:type II toxin-antitoxin system RelE/ParE family toxin [Cytophagaceae bacterium]